RRCEVGTQTLHEGHPHLVQRPCVPDHWSDDVALPVQRMNATDRHGLLARTEPRLRDDTLPDPALERVIVQAEANHSRVQVEQRALVERAHDLGPRRVGMHALPERPDEGRISLPVDVLGGIEDRAPLHAAKLSRKDRAPPLRPRSARVALLAIPGRYSFSATGRPFFWCSCSARLIRAAVTSSSSRWGMGTPSIGSCSANVSPSWTGIMCR